VIAETAVIIIAFLFLKHFIVDFPLQGPFHYLNKGIYGHEGGLQHAMLHGIGTSLVLVWFVNPFAASLFGILDFLIHYHVDWAKMNLNRKLGYAPNTHEQFWWLLGFDQLIHSLTYIFIVYCLL
jgi:hypothetical protein